MSRALVTGASGFVGSHLVESLVRAGDVVRCLVRPTSDTSLLDTLDVETVVGDISTTSNWSNALRNIDTVYHVAALTRALSSRELLSVNARGTALLAKACAAKPSPPKLVVVSSLSAGGTSGRPGSSGSAALGKPVSNYGRSKRAAELAAARWASEVPTTIVRPGVVFGPRDRDTAPLFAAIKTLGIHVIPGFNWSPVAVIDVRDLVEMIRLAAFEGKTIGPLADGPGIYDAADPLTIHYAELGRIIGRAVRRPDVLMMHCPVPLLMTAASCAEFVARLRRCQTTFNLDKMRDATAGSWIGDTSRTQSELGFRPLVDFEQRVYDTARWYESAGWL